MSSPYIGPGVYAMPEAEYHADPCPEPSLSSHVASILLNRSPLHAWVAHPRLNPHFERVDEGKFDLGRAAHELLLCGQSCLAIVEADDWRTKAAREARDAAYAEGKTPLLARQWADVERMAEAVQRQLAVHFEAKEALSNGQPEMALIWKEGVVWCRARLDWLPNEGVIFYDLKTTPDASPDAWQRRLFENGADLQSGFYRRGIRAVLGIQSPRFRFVVVENEPPHAVAVFELDPAAVDLADRKAEEAIRVWGECMKTGTWPAYPPLVHYVAPPAWQMSRWEEREGRKQMVDAAY